MASKMIVAPATAHVAPTVQAIERALRDREVTLFATIDHAAGAREVGLDLDDEVLLIFGSPRVGTSLMQADPRVGYDLPLRMLVWSQDGRTYVGYEDTLALDGRYDLETEQETLLRLRGLLEQLVDAAQKAR